jgi:hypothetical protein
MLSFGYPRFSTTLTDVTFVGANPHYRISVFAVLWLSLIPFSAKRFFAILAIIFDLRK